MAQERAEHLEHHDALKKQPISAGYLGAMRLAVAASFLSLVCIRGFAYAQNSEYGQEAVADLDEGLGKLRKERDKLMDEISHLKTEKMALAEEKQLRIEEVESRATVLNNELDGAHAEIERLKSEKADLADQLKDARFNLDRVNGIFNNKDAVFIKVRDENNRLKTDLADAENALQRSAEKIQKLKKEKESAESELEATKKRLTGYFADQDVELSEIRGQRENLQKEITVLSEKLKAVENKRQAAVLEVQALRNKLLRQAEDASAREAKLKKDLTGTSERKLKEARETSAALAEAERKLKDAEKKITELEEENKASKTMMQLASEKLKYYAMTCEDSKKKQTASPGVSLALEACRRENETLKVQLTALSEDHKKLLDEVAAFKKTARETQQAREASKATK
ncbi:hypothetical protein [Candidatus Velamenicoccus archaeovorus]|uniref:hypothetical protein n=1 Tax=Velamenicoccus archaeovorus TaxID=1930593 RepID=UPI000FFE6F51|nr:hypothetical protein [Candidatus Velamenicoccus archaeovorus]